jgi:hypothetical protein
MDKLSHLVGIEHTLHDPLGCFWWEIQKWHGSLVVCDTVGLFYAAQL